MTLELSPVWAARRDANCCWPEVSIDWAAAGSAAPAPGMEPMSAAAPGAEVDCAWASASAKLVVVAGVLAGVAGVLGLGGSNAVRTDAMSDWIWAILETVSV
jgi:hypothetical protein